MTIASPIKRMFVVVLLIVGACALPRLAKADEGETKAEFFAKDRGQWHQQPVTSATPIYVNGAGNAIAQLVAAKATARLGSGWASTAVSLAKLESGYRCNATGPRVHGGRARGVLQVMPATARALGYAPSQLHDCSTGIDAGIAHMAKCIESGVSNSSQMAACHVAGWAGWKHRLRGRAERYKHQYVSMAMNILHRGR